MHSIYELSQRFTFKKLANFLIDKMIIFDLGTLFGITKIQHINSKSKFRYSLLVSNIHKKNTQTSI